MEMTLLNVNNPTASIITFFRLIPENSKGVMGADIATLNIDVPVNAQYIRNIILAAHTTHDHIYLLRSVCKGILCLKGFHRSGRISVTYCVTPMTWSRAPIKTVC